MARRRAHAPLNIFLNGRLVGRLVKATTGAVEFAYDPTWLDWRHALPISLSLPLRETRYVGAAVAAVFDNLLPDSPPILKRVAERVGAEGTDAYSLLARIGRDCVGALQFLPDGESLDPSGAITAEAISEEEIEGLLKNLARAPLGLDPESEFRISLAGVQEKTALLQHNGRWLRPLGATPTTHILKPQIGRIDTGTGAIDLSNSVENEFYCLKLMAAFGLATTKAEMATFGERKVLVVERFDRRLTRDGRLIRLPQEDLCQALSVPPTLKYENQGGPGIVRIMELLRASDTPIDDQLSFMKAQILFWMIGATDGHAKNFSLFLSPGGGFRLAPFYDVLTVRPDFDAKQIPQKAFRLAMSVGHNPKYRIDEIHGRHFAESAKHAGLGRALFKRILDEITADAEPALAKVAASLPNDFPDSIHASVCAAVTRQMERLQTAQAA